MCLSLHSAPVCWVQQPSRHLLTYLLTAAGAWGVLLAAFVAEAILDKTQLSMRLGCCRR